MNVSFCGPAARTCGDWPFRRRSLSDGLGQIATRSKQGAEPRLLLRPPRRGTEEQRLASAPSRGAAQIAASSVQGPERSRFAVSQEAVTDARASIKNIKMAVQRPRSLRHRFFDFFVNWLVSSACRPRQLYILVPPIGGSQVAPAKIAWRDAVPEGSGSEQG